LTTSNLLPLLSTSCYASVAHLKDVFQELNSFTGCVKVRNNDDMH
jgi:hypothetical protein